ncbi:MAG: 2-amino-4-hydroxy-6-hydroxymethyldihydropteridine diphosphokinase [Cycloclasticus pugetii]|uniref:2-amino-4-hydroxy-6-hydroxymethyldihydropteridine pyrophosphokinase n=1 Tax=Cycloclasticus zancles 78-ME TaxID=1198232 RepID=S5TZS8_9GAMM|nr:MULTISPECIES: 2-amino-4-hydroxy-6-hydroxymethyldihydropteridine diphosphokinase [Cycloclasticus]AGS40528.1 2-amino-4-hydroxy-6-hydroxymethyldihydropteridine diphosphokinase [Cycloclasticus zancles 78-ME]MBV1898718.1 2-amino-4-hydroxy-6-hydroxymethyldihydropteridine diphosphokinase [Cycloclasticus sp.]MDF1829677.1 2-amino-4-hydroxy-6-hydroxymethyldihydropteridine diphosphokinase [Cycloclasticus pugetii]SHJ52256.1 2-amino-4-hydroxy-6-hydroxymethyldihydropteridinediphosphokinase [Cycloclasticus
MQHSVSAYIGLGSNLSNPTQQVLTAIERIKQLKNCSLELVSSLYQTPPMGPQDQPDYTNAVAKISTSLTPYELLNSLQAIENQHGRTRDSGRWGARTLDLDILLYDALVSQDPELTLPHPGIASRAFVLYPLIELNKDLNIPTLGPVQTLIDKLNDSAPTRLDSAKI